MFPIIDKMPVLKIMGNTMPATAPKLTLAAQAKLADLGKQIRARRKALGVNATAAAEAAGMSRVTLHRIENGEPSVTMGAYLNAMLALGLTPALLDPATANKTAIEADHQGWIPARIRLADYPQLKLLAWQVQGTDELTPLEAFDIYERNTRHLDSDALEPREQQLLDALRLALGGARRNV